MMSGIERMDTYFKNMNAALARRKIGVQYCMQLPRNILESTQEPSVFSVQASHDHYPDMSQNPHEVTEEFVFKHLLFTSGLYGAVGLWPSRDNIQTVADKNAFDDLLLADLMGGQIQLGHEVGKGDYNLLKKTLRSADSVVLKADRPIAPLDKCYETGCAVGFTESVHARTSWYYVLSLPSAGFTSSFSLADLGSSWESVVYDFDSHETNRVGVETSITLHRGKNRQYVIVAPILPGQVAVFGDTSKFVSMADERIASVESDGHVLRVGVIAGRGDNPVITGYSERPIQFVGVNELISLRRTQTPTDFDHEASGWTWDKVTKLWQVKLGFTDSGVLETKTFALRAKSVDE